MCIEITMSTSNSLKLILYMCVRLRMKLEYAFFNPTAKSVIFFFRTKHIYTSCLNISTLCIIKNDDISIFSKIVCFINVNNFAEYTSLVVFTAIPEVWLKITCCWSIQYHISISSIDYIIIILLISCSEFDLAIGRNYVNKSSI